MMSTKREGARLTISRPILRLVADGFWGERERGGGGVLTLVDVHMYNKQISFFT